MLENVFFRAGKPVRIVTGSLGDPVAVECVLARIRTAARGNPLVGGALLPVGEPIGGYLDVETTAAELAAVGLSESAANGGELEAAVAAVSRDRRCSPGHVGEELADVLAVSGMEPVKVC